MNDISNYIKSFLFQVKENTVGFSPLKIDISSMYSSAEMALIVNLIDNNLEDFKIEYLDLIIKERFEDLLRWFETTIKLLNNQLPFDTVQGLIMDNCGITISEADIPTAIENPKNIISSRLDVGSEEQLSKLFYARKHSYSITQSQNIIFQNHQDAFVIAVILIENEIKKYCKPYTKNSSDYTELANFILKKNITINEQFSKYDLITLDDNIKLKDVYPPRIFFEKEEITIFLNGIDKLTYQTLTRVNKKYDLKLSLKPSSIFFLDAKYNSGKLNEEIETGGYFNIENFDSKIITKLFDKFYNNLWVIIDSGEITFEEILVDNLQEDDIVITQVVHSQYAINNEDNVIINHLDHEFIFYTKSEIEMRKSNPKQKGEARKRVKTFKIDNAEIPLRRDNILHKILQAKFKNSELINEYFNSVKTNAQNS